MSANERCQEGEGYLDWGSVGLHPAPWRKGEREKGLTRETVWHASMVILVEVKQDRLKKNI